ALDRSLTGPVLPGTVSAPASGAVGNPFAQMLSSPMTFARRQQGVLSRIVPDRRRYKRISVTLLGRFMRESKEEHPCKLIDISAGGGAVMAPVAVPLGERVVAYFDHIGGIEGMVVREFEAGFAIRI